MSNTIAVPSPTTGKRSPLRGIGRVISGPAAARPSPPYSTAPVARPAAAARKCRRETGTISAMCNPSVRGSGDARRAALLRASERDRDEEPAGGERNRNERYRAQLHAERAQRREQPAARGVRAAEDHDVDHVLCLVFLLAREHREQHLARRVGDSEVG